MNPIEYKVKLKNSLDAFFNVSLDKEFQNKKFDLFANFRSRNARYMLSKKAEIYAYKSNEYVFYNNVESVIDNNILDSMKNFLTKNVDNIIEVDNEHMSSMMNVIYTTNGGITEEIKKKIRKFSFYKSYKLGFKGWVNTRLIVVDLSTNEIYTNKLARKEGKKFLFKN